MEKGLMKGMEMSQMWPEVRVRTLLDLVLLLRVDCYLA